jgi:hypothetical protein
MATRAPHGTRRRIGTGRGPNGDRSYRQAVPGGTNTCRAIAFDWVVPFTV